MAHIGMKYPVFAPLNEKQTDYTEGFVVGKAIKYSGTPNKNDVELYADDGVCETDKTMKDESVSLNVDDLSLKVQADLLGHKYTEAKDPDTPESIVVNAGDNAPFGGLGFYKRRKKNNIVTFTAIWLRKVQFAEPSEEAETKGDTTNFQTPTIEGKAYQVDNGDIKEKAVFTEESKAVEWLNKKAKIGG